MRPVRIKGRQYLGIEEKTRKQVWHDFEWSGTFHQWGIQSVEDSAGNMNDSMAIVEDAKGKIHMIAPEFVTFIDVPHTLP